MSYAPRYIQNFIHAGKLSWMVRVNVQNYNLSIINREIGLVIVSDVLTQHIRIPIRVASDPFSLSFGKSLPTVYKNIRVQLDHRNIFYPSPKFHFPNLPNWISRLFLLINSELVTHPKYPAYFWVTVQHFYILSQGDEPHGSARNLYNQVCHI